MCSSDLALGSPARGDRLAGMDNGAVIATAKSVADLLERVFGQCARQIHCDLPRNGDVVGPTLAGHIAVANLVVIGHLLLDRLDGELILRLLHQHVLEKHLRRRQIDGLAGQGRVACDLDQGTFEATNILGDILRDEVRDGTRDVEFQIGGLGAQDRKSVV